MDAEIIGVGTELLLGQIANTNAQTISQALARAGINVFFHTAVGDNAGRMGEVIRSAQTRSDAVIITGGLGPTPDDITREAVAGATGRGLQRDPELAGQIRAIFERLGRAMPDENLKQADLPEGAAPIAPRGTAPGFHLEHDGCLIIALPGVPWEMKAMLAEDVMPLLGARAGDAVIFTREVLVIGLGESHTHERIADIVASQSNPTIAFLAGGGQVRVRITAKASSDAEARGLVEPVENAIRDRLGRSAVPGMGETLAEALGTMLRDRGATVAVAESLTGGLIGAELTAVGGSSDFFAGSVACYTTESKRDVVGVDESILAGPGPVSEAAAGALAEGAARLFGASLGLAATGVAGPAEQDGVPVGTIFVGATFGGRTEVRRVRGYGDRVNIRAIALTAALDLGRRLVEEE
ncbi:MAG: competence/damage-inducible protein A [Actinomycetota bacterium]